MPDMRHSIVLLAFASLAAQTSRPSVSKSTPVVESRGHYVIEAGDHRLRDLVTRSAQLLERTELVNWSESPEGGDATVIEPEELRDQVRAAAARLQRGHRA